MDYYYPEKLKEHKVTKSIPNLTNWSLTNGSNYKELKRYNPWLRKNFLPDESRKIYKIKIPLDTSSLIFNDIEFGVDSLK